MTSDLDQYEREILELYETDKLVPVENQAAEIERLREAARATLREDRRVNIRMTSRDLEELRKRAVIEGIPYQTLISSVLHKFVNGRLKDIGR